MAKQRFYIGPYDSQSGQDTSLKPFVIPDQAFKELTNAYVFRDRTRKRFGSRYIDTTLGQNATRLRVLLGATDGSGNLSGTVPGSVGAVGQAFSIGNLFFTVVTAGNAANPLLVAGGTVGTATFNTTTGAYVFAGATITTNVYWYPALPVMGLISLEEDETPSQSDIAYQPTIAFDTSYAYSYVLGSGWSRLSSEGAGNTGAATWLGDNGQFFWATNWVGADPSDFILFVTNNNINETNGMRYYDGTSWWNFAPQIDPTPTYLNQAAILVVFKNRLIALNTWESATKYTGGTQTQYQFRARYSAAGSPIDNSGSSYYPFSVASGGNAIDAPTTEAIVTAQFVRDHLIVFFERSTWELVYTGNQIYPFQWYKLNTELGAESTFSIIPFDRITIGVGNVGIHACNGSSVERIDDRIPDSVFDIHNVDEGVNRVYGIRDYKTEMLYWAFPGLDASSTQPFPNRVLVYNYKQRTWSFFEDSITAFGYYQDTTDAITWSSTDITFSDDILWADGPGQTQFRSVLAGNQEGYTFVCDPDVVVNAPVLQLTNITVAGNIATATVTNHNLRQNDYFQIQNIYSTTDTWNGLNLYIFSVQDVLTANTFTFVIGNPDPDIIILIPTGTYKGNGTIARVTPPFILTKQYNFFAQQGVDFNVNKIDFLVDSTAVGQTTVYFLTNTSPNPSSNTTSTPVLEMFPYPLFYPYEATSEQLWRSLYFEAQGEYIQLQIGMTDLQITNITIETDENGVQYAVGPALEDFQLHAFIFYAQTTGRLE